MMESSNFNNEQQNQHILGIASYGSLASIKETSSPICHISFYLKCCVGCGIVPSRTSRGNIVDPTITRILIDYEHADRLPGDWQRLLLDIVLNELKVERLLNDVFYVDDEHITLPENASNSFFAIETGTTESILLQQYFLRYGLPQQSGANNNNNTHRIMFCTSQWLEEFYFNPIKELQRRAECINSTLSDPLLPASSNMFLLNQGGNFFHCTHCRGVPGLCACECGCPTSSSGRQTRCKALHRGIVCSSCNQNGIEGKLYICATCSPKTPGNNERFCERCYEDGVHDQTHSFYCFDHAPAVVPRLIPPRVQAEQTTTQNQEEGSCCSPLDMLLQLYIPTAMAVPIQECNTCEAAVADVAAAAASDTVVVSTSNSHDDDDDDDDDYDESMTLDGIFDDDDEITSTTSSSSINHITHHHHHHRFSKGQMVRLVGFSSNHTNMNGKEGIVLSVIDTDRCYGVVQVQIIAPYCQQEHLTVYTVRPENLIQVLSCGGNGITARAPSSSSASCY